MKKIEKMSYDEFVNSLRESSISKSFVAGSGKDHVGIFISKSIDPEEHRRDDVTIEIVSFAGGADYLNIKDCLTSQKVTDYLDEILPAKTGDKFGVWAVEITSPYCKDYTFYNGHDKIKVSVWRSLSTMTTPPHPCHFRIRMPSKAANRNNLYECLKDERFLDYFMRVTKKKFRPRKDDYPLL